MARSGRALASGDYGRAADNIAKAPTAAGYADVPRAHVLEQAAAAIEAERSTIPPSTSPDRRIKVIERSTLSRAATTVRALAGQGSNQPS